MRGLRIYPPLAWVILLTPVALGLAFPVAVTGMVIFAYGALLPAFRNKFLHPQGQEDRSYYHWLKTVPYTTGKRLPNGSVMPGLADALALVILCFSFARFDVDPIIKLLIIASFLMLVISIFTIIVSRQLMNLGPAWIGYVCLCLLVITLACFKGNAIAEGHVWAIAVPLLPVVIAFIAALIGLKLMMNRYPWGGKELNTSAVLDNRTLKELVYGQPGVHEMGEPFTSLNPRATWPRLRSVHVWGLSLLVGSICLSLLAHIPMYDAGVFGFVGIAVTYGRMMTYYSNLDATTPRAPKLELLRNGNWRRNFAFSLFTLLLMTGAGYVLLRLIPDTAGMFISPIAATLICVTSFRLPPSRATWETTGFRQISLTPPTSAAEENKRQRKNFRLRRV